MSAENLKIINNKELQETLYHYTIIPDMDLYVLPKPGYLKKYAVFATRFGSTDSHFSIGSDSTGIEIPAGTAHFLEHRLFEDEQGSVIDRFAAFGASANAYTAFNQTAYLFSCTSNFEQSLELLLNFVQEPHFPAQAVQREQGIIGQEIKMYQDHPHWCVFFNLLAALYQHHPVRNDIAGTIESIAEITPDLLYRCYHTFYHPGNMALFVVGDLVPEQVAGQIEQNIAKRNYQPVADIKRQYPAEPDSVSRQRVNQNLVVSEPLFALGYKDVVVEKLTGSELIRRELIMEIVLSAIFGTSERFYNDQYGDSLIGDDFGFEYSCESSFGYTMISGESRDPERLYERILAVIKEYRAKGISAEQFERHRRSLLGGFIRQFNSLEYIANNFLAYRFKDADMFSIPAVLQNISCDEANNLMTESLLTGLHAVSLILPQTD